MEIDHTEHQDDDFLEQVETLSHTSLSRCWHCLTCSGGCPFVEDMDFNPNAIIRMVQFGMKDKVLNSSTIWLWTDPCEKPG